MLVAGRVEAGWGSASFVAPSSCGRQADMSSQRPVIGQAGCLSGLLGDLKLDGAPLSQVIAEG